MKSEDIRNTYLDFFEDSMARLRAGIEAVGGIPPIENEEREA